MTFERDLADIVGEEHVHVQAPLSEYTTFRIGGPAQFVVEPSSEHEVCEIVTLCRACDVPFRVLGLGSNVLASDEGIDGVVIRLADRFSAIEIDGCILVAQAGATNEAIAEASCKAGLAGYEFASGIPGTVGGAAIMNAGAYDGEFRHVALEVRCLTPEGDIVDVPAKEAAWSYRHSMMMDKGYVVLGATLELAPSSEHEVRAVIDDLSARRAEKQPLDMPSAGSTFKRPEGYYAGKLIQDAGLRGYCIGGAQVSEKHTGFVVNAGNATAADVRALIAYVQQRVLENDGVLLEPEVRVWE